MDLNIDFTSDDFKADPGAVIGAAVEEMISGLKTKNGELIGKLKQVKSGSSESDAELEKLRQFKETADLTSAETKGDYDKALKLANDRHMSELDKLTSKLTVSQGQLEKLLIDDGLSAALDAVNILPALKPAAKALLRADTLLVDGKAMIGENSLSEFVSSWAAQDEGKAFVKAPDNSGGGANGDNKPGGAQSQNPWVTGNLTDQGNMIRENPEMANSLKSQAA